jgi:hypothetical protein
MRPLFRSHTIRNPYTLMFVSNLARWATIARLYYDCINFSFPEAHEAPVEIDPSIPVCFYWKICAVPLGRRSVPTAHPQISGVLAKPRKVEKPFLDSVQKDFQARRSRSGRIVVLHRMRV